MQINQDNQWVNIVAKLALARSILGTATSDIDNIVSEINAGRSNLSEQTATMLENVVKDLMSISECIGDASTDVPEILLGLSQQCYQTEESPNHTQNFDDSTRFNFDKLDRKAS
jgi:hypothetical protein